MGIKDEQGKLKTPDLFTAEDQSRVNKYIKWQNSTTSTKKLNVSDPTAVAKAQSRKCKRLLIHKLKILEKFLDDINSMVEDS